VPAALQNGNVAPRAVEPETGTSVQNVRLTGYRNDASSLLAQGDIP